MLGTSKNKKREKVRRNTQEKELQLGDFFAYFINNYQKKNH